MKIKVLLNGIINYAAAVALAVVFALYMSGRVGWFITIAFICAPHYIGAAYKALHDKAQHRV